MSLLVSDLCVSVCLCLPLYLAISLQRVNFIRDISDRGVADHRAAKTRVAIEAMKQEHAAKDLGDMTK